MFDKDQRLFEMLYSYLIAQKHTMNKHIRSEFAVCLKLPFTSFLNESWLHESHLFKLPVYVMYMLSPETPLQLFSTHCSRHPIPSSVLPCGRSGIQSGDVLQSVQGRGGHKAFPEMNRRAVTGKELTVGEMFEDCISLQNSLRKSLFKGNLWFEEY